jgi:aminomethyltransferase
VSDSERPRLLPLHDVHAAAGAVFRTRLGWSLPAHYGDPEAEHRAIREEAALLDRSHRSRFLVTGTDASDVLAAVFEGHPNELEEGRARRTVALDEEGHIVDLVLVARTGGIAYVVSGEPGQRLETLRRLRQAATGDMDVAVEDRTETTCLVGLAGPRAPELARQHLSEGLPGLLPPLHAATFVLHGFRALAIRTSDTGEDGFELMLGPPVAQHLVEALMDAGVPLAGDLAQETARIEACLPAYSPDLETGLTPAEADLDVLLGIPGGREGGVILSALLIDGEQPPPPGTPVMAGGERAGEARSAARSARLDAIAVLAVIDQRRAVPGTPFEVGGFRGPLVAKPFYRRRQ